MHTQLTEPKSDRCHHKLLETSPIGLALCRTDGTFLEANSAFASIIGGRVEETLNLNYWEILETECIGREKNYLESQTKNSNTGPYQAAYKHKNGHLVPVRVCEWTIETEGESLIWLSAEKILNARVQNNAMSETGQNYWNSNLENLLAQQTAELAKTNEQLQQKIAELQKTQEKLRYQSQILAQIQESVICTDMKGFITSWNQASEKLYGYRESEVIGQHIALIYSPKQQEFLLEQVIKPLQVKGSHEIEVMTRRQSGEDFHSHLSLSPLKDSTGEVCGMIGYLTDISDRKALETELSRIEVTDRKLAEEALRQSEQLYRTLASNFPNGAVMLFDRELRYTLAEGTELAAVGLSKELMEGKTIWEIFPPEFCCAVEPN